MKRNVYVLALTLALTAAYAVAQMPGGPQQPQPGMPPDATQPGPAPDQQDPWGQPEEQPQQDRGQEQVDDQQLEQEVRARFQTDAALSGIQVNVENGEVHLEGTVASKDEKKRAKRMAKEVAGVRKVRDRELRVDAEAAAAAQQQQQQEQPGAIGMPAEDRDDPEQPPQQDPYGQQPGTTQQPGVTQPQTGVGTEQQFGEQVCVPADDQALYLVGAVRSEQEKQQIRSQLQQIQGVMRVDDTHLRVEAETGITQEQPGQQQPGQEQQPGIGQPADRPIGQPEDRPVDPDAERPIGQPEDRPIGAPEDRPGQQPDQWGTQPDTQQPGTEPGAIGAPGAGTEQQQIGQQICVPADARTVYVIGRLQSEQDKQQVRQQLLAIGITQVDDTHLRVETEMPGMPQEDRPQHEEHPQPEEHPDTLPQEDRPDDPAAQDPAAIGDPEQDPMGVEHDHVGVQDDQMGAAADTEQLKSQIESALRNEPTLAQRNISVNVTQDAVEISGTVQSNEERENARRIARSFAGHRQVQDQLTVEGEQPQEDPWQQEQQRPEGDVEEQYPQGPPTWY